MKSRSRIFSIFFAAVGMLVLILDSKTALKGAMEGIDLCIRTAIPSLLPFFIFSILLTGQLNGTDIPLLRPLGKICKIPSGSEAILAVGLLGGYPVGASCVAQVYRSGQLSKADAHRLLGFCSNAGPAFLFGIVSHLFSSARTVWVLWGIHILSALMAGMLLPGKRSSQVRSRPTRGITLPAALQQAVQVMASVCGWIVLFRVIITICSRWFLWLFPEIVQVTITGLLELVNGCHALNNLPSESLRFILCAGFLAFGGLCVTMQTASVTEGLGMGMYIPGKILQCIISLITAGCVSGFLFRDEGVVNIQWLLPVFLITACVMLTYCIKKKKTVDFPFQLIYNK